MPFASSHSLILLSKDGRSLPLNIFIFISNASVAIWLWSNQSCTGIVDDIPELTGRFLLPNAPCSERHGIRRAIQKGLAAMPRCNEECCCRFYSVKKLLTPFCAE